MSHPPFSFFEKKPANRSILEWQDVNVAGFYLRHANKAAHYEFM
jgi:hypothetical protein